MSHMAAANLAKILSLDSAFSWTLESEIAGPGYRCVALSLTSQEWSPPVRCDRATWRHWMTVTIPNHITTSVAFLHVGGGINESAAPVGPLPYHADMAVQTGAVVVELGQVPNQPIRFANSQDREFCEDGLIAYLQARYDEAQGPSALIRTAMARSVTAAMTAVQQFMALEAPVRPKIVSFVLSGGSKRGWAAWLAALADPRVIGVIPIAINVINVEATTRHHWESWGRFSPALDDYIAEGLIPDQIGSARMAAINGIEDLASYFEHPRMSIPKLIIVASGDQFFPIDNTRFSWSRLPGPKHIRILPNTDHSTVGSDINETKTAWFGEIAHGRTLPALEWSIGQNDVLTLRAEFSPSRAFWWRACNPEARDFTCTPLGPVFTATELLPGTDGTFRADLTAPVRGYAAHFVELRFPLGGGREARFTTEAFIRPDTLPYNWADAFA